MSAPRLGDAAFKYTEGGQDYWHHLGHPLHRAVADVTQRVDTFRSADYTTERRIAIGSGVQDLKATIRKDGQPESLRRFLASARRGAALEYFPSLASPSESYPCSLLSDSAVALDGDFWFEYRNSVDVVLRRTDGGSWVGLTEGTLFYYTAGNDLPGLTFTRSGTVGSYVDEDGYVQTASTADTFRTTWIDGEPYLLLERAGENVYGFSDDLSDASWTKTRTTVAQNAGLMGPNGVTSASSGVFGMVETVDTGVHYIEQTLPSLTDDTDQVTTLWARASSRSVVFIQTINKANRSDTSYFNLSTGALGTVDADHVNVTIEAGPLAGAFRWYKVGVVWDAGTGGTTPRAIIGMTNADGTTSYTGDGSSQIFVWNPGFEVDTGGGPSSDIVTDSATDVSRAADTFYADFLHAPQEMTVYAKFIERGLVGASSYSRLFQIGNVGTSSEYVFSVQINASDYYQAVHEQANGTGGVSSAAAVTPELGDLVEVRAVLNADGSVQAGVSVNSAAETTGSASSAKTLGASWSDPVISLASSGGAAFRSVKIARGVKTLAEMRAL